MSTTDLKIEIGGEIITPLSATIRKTMDTGVDSWAAPVAWTPGLDPNIDEIALPIKSPDAKVYIGGELQITGYMSNPHPALGGDGQRLNFEGVSSTADIVDSTKSKPPYTSKDATLETWAKELVEPHGLKPVFDVDSGGPFTEGMTIGKTEKIFTHLLKYASQRGILIANTPRGHPLFWKAITSGFPVATIEEGSDFKFSQSATSYEASYDARKIYQSYRAIRDTPDTADPLDKIFGTSIKSKGSAVAVDNNVTRARFLTFLANETTAGDLQKAADWARSAIYAEMLSMVLPMPGWTILNSDNIWEVNTLLALTSPTLMLPNGYTFLIKEVEFILDKGMQSTNLSLVPPQVYSGDPIDYPWSTAAGGGLSGLAALAANFF